MIGGALQQHARARVDELHGASLAQHGRPFTPHLDVWKVRGKVFLIVTDDDPDLQIITVKIDPPYGDALRRDHETITPGHYLDKRHWTSVGPGTGITTELIEDLVYRSYDLAGGLKPGHS